MSADEVEYGSVDNIFQKEIKGKIDAPWRFQRQLERCNILMAGEDQEAFAASVRALLGDLPIHIKNNIKGRGGPIRPILCSNCDTIFIPVCPECEPDFIPKDTGRQGEFNSMTPDEWSYQENCGVQVGTPKNPFVIVAGHPEWDFLLDIPKPYREEHDEEIDRISPTLILGHLETDYENLYEIIKEEADAGNLGWRYDKVVKESGPVETPILESLAREIEEANIKVMIKHRRAGHVYSWAELVGSQIHRTPRTPMPPKEEKQEVEK